METRAQGERKELEEGAQGRSWRSAEGGIGIVSSRYQKQQTITSLERIAKDVDKIR